MTIDTTIHNSAPGPLPPEPDARQDHPSGSRRSHRRSRYITILVLVVALIGSGLTRRLVRSQRDRIVYGDRPASVDARSSLAKMNSFALGLLLGGLRGPLVMILWTSSETQKNQRDLEGLDTKIEWIRLLQPEFDSVHLFQIWNKAYNISAQLSSLSNKYTAILDALEYAENVDRQRPGDINILSTIGDLYAEKLGSSAQKLYYRRRIRTETQQRDWSVIFPQTRLDAFRAAAANAGINVTDAALRKNAKNGTIAVTLKPLERPKIQMLFSGPDIHYREQTRQIANQNDPAWKRLEHEPMLDAHGNILPQYLKGYRTAPPPDLPKGAQWNTGAELQYLKPYEPFPYGLSTFALAYNYHKRAQILERYYGQHHIQKSDLVIDSRPAVALKMWAEGDWSLGRRLELRAFGKPPANPTNLLSLEMPTASLPLDAKPVDSAVDINEILHEYERAARLASDAIPEYLAHLKINNTNYFTYQSHMDRLRMLRQLMLADAAYLRAMRATADQRPALIDAAREHYQAMIPLARHIILKYYTDDSLVKDLYPKGMDRSNVDQLTNEQTARILAEVAQRIKTRAFDEHPDETREYRTYIQRAQARLAQLTPAKK